MISLQNICRLLTNRNTTVLGAGLATVIGLYFLYVSVIDARSIATIETWDTFQKFTQSVLDNHSVACDLDGNLQGIYLKQYEALVDVIGDQSVPCVRLPSPVENLSVVVLPSSSAPSYEDWNSFNASEEKTAALWVGGVPLTIDVSAIDYSSIETQFRSALKQANDCTRDEQANADFSFSQLECHWTLDDDNNPKLVRIGARGK